MSRTADSTIMEASSRSCSNATRLVLLLVTNSTLACSLGAAKLKKRRDPNRSHRGWAPKLDWRMPEN